MKVTLKNGLSFECFENISVFDSAKQNQIYLEHSCLTARCRSCISKVISGETVNIQDEHVLSDEERENGYILTCNVYPKSDLKLDIEDLGDVTLYEKKIFPSKIDAIDMLTDDVVKISLRLPPTLKFKFNAGQYVNLTKNNIKRSYSVANYSNNRLEFFIKNYEGGLMSKYWFEGAKVNDLVRIEGPLGAFFIRETHQKNILFLATGTGIAPVKSILDFLQDNQDRISGKKIWVFNGTRYAKDLFWNPVYENMELTYIPVLSREDGESLFRGYVQDAVIEQEINLELSQVYACGSLSMINSAKKVLLQNGLNENDFFSDAFVETN